jgi:predicted small metal-binding protein
MLHVGCKDIGIEGCDFVADGQKVRKVENAVLEHLRDVHPHIVAGLTDVQHKALEARIRSGMHGLEPGVAHGSGKHVTLRISCADFGFPGCGFVAEESKVRKVEEKFFDHLREHHPEVVAGLSVAQHDDLEHRVREAIRQK